MIRTALILAICCLTGCVTLPTGKSSSGQQCDLSKPETTPLSRFRIDEAAGTVFDTQTNLTWKRCAEGQTYKAGRCEGEAGNWKWDGAVAKFGVEGSGWRLPNIDELTSIIEKRCEFPSMNLQVFHIPPSDWFWSGSLYADYSYNAWSANFNSGLLNNYSRKSDGYVRLVRGDQWFDPSGILIKEKREREERLAREAEEARQTEIKQREAEEEKRRKQEELKKQVTELLEAEKSAVFFCPDKTVCDKAFSLTQIYLNQTADMKIQVATDTIVETYNPTEDGKLGLKAIRIPGKGDSAAIKLTATCKDEKGHYAEVCRLGKTSAYSGFRSFIEQMLK